MINKDELIKNVQRLLQGYANSSNDIKVTTRTPNEADVYIDGKLFNTYLIEEKIFKHNIVSLNSMNEDFKITVIIADEALIENHSQYKGAELQLPASKSEIRDAFERARMKSDSTGYKILRCIMYGIDFAKDIKEKSLDLNMLNYLAKVLTPFSIYEHKQLCAYMQKRGLFNLKIKDIINLAYNLDNSEFIEGITDAESLGRMYADNGMLEYLLNADERIWKYLNYAAIGNDIREQSNGIFTEDGFFTENKELYETVFDGITYPEKFEEDNYIFKLHIERLSPDKRSAWLTLPATKEEKEELLKELNAESFDECRIDRITSIDSKIPMCVKDLSQLDLLNALAYKITDMEKNGESAKFKAIIEGFGCESLEEAVKYANSLNDYELYPKASTAIEYAKDIFREKYESILPESFIEHFNFASYSVELRNSEEFAISEYGVIKNKVKTPEKKVQEDKQET